jgi:hypothetical protein
MDSVQIIVNGQPYNAHPADYGELVIDVNAGESALEIMG